MVSNGVGLNSSEKKGLESRNHQHQGLNNSQATAIHGAGCPAVVWRLEAGADGPCEAGQDARMASQANSGQVRLSCSGEDEDQITRQRHGIIQPCCLLSTLRECSFSLSGRGNQSSTETTLHGERPEVAAAGVPTSAELLRCRQP